MCLCYIVVVPLLGSLIMLHILISFNLFLLHYFVPQRVASYIVWCPSMRLHIISLRTVNYWFRGFLATIKCQCLCMYYDSVLMSLELCHFGLWAYKVTTGSLRYKMLERTFETRQHGKCMIQCFQRSNNGRRLHRYFTFTQLILAILKLSHIGMWVHTCICMDVQ